VKIGLCSRSISFKKGRWIHKELLKRKMVLDFEMRDLFMEPFTQIDFQGMITCAKIKIVKSRQEKKKLRGRRPAVVA